MSDYQSSGSRGHDADGRSASSDFADASRERPIAARGGYKICRQGHVFRGFDITCPYCSLLTAKGGRKPRLR